MNDSEKFDLILQRLDKIEQDTHQMVEHISFINSMYQKYKSGLEFMHHFFNRCK